MKIHQYTQSISVLVDFDNKGVFIFPQVNIFLSEMYFQELPHPILDYFCQNCDKFIKTFISIILV